MKTGSSSPTIPSFSNTSKEVVKEVKGLLEKDRELSLVVNSRLLFSSADRCLDKFWPHHQNFAIFY